VCLRLWESVLLELSRVFSREIVFLCWKWWHLDSADAFAIFLLLMWICRWRFMIKLAA
jgi:hypothetical protein